MKSFRVAIVFVLAAGVCAGSACSKSINALSVDGAVSADSGAAGALTDAATGQGGGRGYGGAGEGAGTGGRGLAGNSGAGGSLGVGGISGGGGTQGGGGAGGAGTGSSGTGGALGTGGTGVPAVTVCPATPPADQDSCGGTWVVCDYENCAGLGAYAIGRTIATCSTRIWQVLHSADCAPVSCNESYGSGSACPAGEICVINQGGARISTCQPHTCGTGPIRSDCVVGIYGSVCTVMSTLEAGPVVTCNTCPGGGCP